MVLLARIAQVGHTPAFVDRHPDYDGRMIVIALDGFHPFAREPLDVAIVEEISVRHLARDQEAHVVGPIEKSGIFQLLVLACAIESHLLGHADVVLYRVIRGWREYA